MCWKKCILELDSNVAFAANGWKNTDNFTTFTAFPSKSTLYNEIEKYSSGKRDSKFSPIFH